MRSSVLEVAYKDMGIGPSSKHNHETYGVAELEALLNIVFQYVNQERAAQPINVEESTEITLNYLLKCLDRLASISSTIKSKQASMYFSF